MVVIAVAVTVVVVVVAVVVVKVMEVVEVIVVVLVIVVPSVNKNIYTHVYECKAIKVKMFNCGGRTKRLLLILGQPCT